LIKDFDLGLFIPLCEGNMPISIGQLPQCQPESQVTGDFVWKGIQNWGPRLNNLFSLLCSAVNSLLLSCQYRRDWRSWHV